ncbi:hypothetical protein [Thermogemmatispora tikiterensis]|uniref:Uncharacterized protein n=1 Tax=Thermogemmatispora tikiterensis TaxID=1825093 RepID=A0A328VB26_9CHLR|nr:hypothetical protein [Thermogemmatispora tikiterensis]RAQ94827.1 hypothetical protein A4R35_04715 [Thermogemmatispora tikiterensis]
MVLLISGGSLVLGLLAIIALIWVIRSTSAEDLSSRGPSSAAPHVEVAPALESEEREALPAGEDHRAPYRGHELALLNPELHALATQLRTLHQQSAELEQRLDILIQVVERIERSLPAPAEAANNAGAEAQEPGPSQS